MGSFQTTGDHIRRLIPPAKPGERPRELDMRLVVDTIFYAVVGGIQWRLLPKEYPNWKSVYYYFRLWRDDGTWQPIHDTVRSQMRQRNGRHRHPTAGSIDSSDPIGQSS